VGQRFRRLCAEFGTEVDDRDGRLVIDWVESDTKTSAGWQRSGASRGEPRRMVTQLAAGSLAPPGPVARAMADLWWPMLGLGVAVFVVFAVSAIMGGIGSKKPGAGTYRRRTADAVG
jgi:hypothetical protein